MMKNKLLIFLFLLPFLANSQSVDYNTIILPDAATDISFAEKLVRLAWKNNPSNRILEREKTISEYEIKQARWSWLNEFRIQGNVNEFVLNDNADVGNRADFFPKYNVTGQVRLGFFVDIPLETKKKKEEYYIAQSNIDLQKLSLRAEVLRRYEMYLMNRELLKVQTEATEDLFATFSIVEQNFKNGQATLEEYNRTLDRYNTQKIRKITAQGNFNRSKIEVEEVIGVKLEDVI